jgi:GNAT superfamily N-acetyltransferase
MVSIINSPFELSNDQIRAICVLKNQHWPYPIESQLYWWDKYTNKDDIFVRIFNNNSTMAFLRLRKRKASVGNKFLTVFCVTEVCVDKALQGKGIGRELMNEARMFIDKTEHCLAYLLCTNKQSNFYRACGWHQFISPIIKSTDGRESRELKVHERCMIYDPKMHINGKLILYGDVF